MKKRLKLWRQTWTVLKVLIFVGLTAYDTQKIKKTEEEINIKLKSTYENLNSWQKTLLQDMRTGLEQIFI